MDIEKKELCQGKKYLETLRATLVLPKYFPGSDWIRVPTQDSLPKRGKQRTIIMAAPVKRRRPGESDASYAARLRRANRKKNKANKIVSFQKTNWANRKAPVPTTFPTIMKYADRISIDPIAGGIGAAHVFSATGLFDPDITATGHQPRGFDQIIALYDHYVVVGSKIKAMFAGSSASSTATQLCTLALRDSATVGTTGKDYTESGYVQSGVVGLRDGGNACITLEMACNPNKFLGRSHPLSDSTLKGSASANPSEQAYWHLFCETLNASSDGDPTLVYVEIEYSVVFIEPKVPSQS